MSTIYSCENCKALYPKVGLPYRCSKCSGIYALSQLNSDYLNDKFKYLPGIWKYRSTFGLSDQTPMAYLGEGETPLVSGKIYGESVYFKLESLNPTGSFKDRGTAVLISTLLERGIKEAIEDSSGNAGASFAAYTSAFNIKANIFIPESTSGPKAKQIEAYGATIIKIPGNRINTTKAAVKKIEETNIPYASHAYQPFGLSGIATIAYELVDQMHVMPKTIIVPVGHGSLMLGLMLGFINLQRAEIIKTIPNFIGVQPKAFSPLVSKSIHNIFRPTDTSTIAEGTKILEPIRGNAILSRLSKQDMFLSVDDDEIKEAHRLLAGTGIYVEPTSAMVAAALKRLVGKIDPPIVLIMTGFGLKSNQITN